MIDKELTFLSFPLTALCLMDIIKVLMTLSQDGYLVLRGML